MTSQASHPPPAPTLLVVEDDFDILELYEALLMDEGYRVLPANTGKAALEQIAAEPVHGIVLDRRLPDFDGLDLCRLFRQRIESRVPIILITADHNGELEAEAHAAGSTAFMVKPFHSADLLASIRRLVYWPAASG